MDYSFAFLSHPAFYFLLVMGITALIPRARYVADRIDARVMNPHIGELKPNLAQRVCLFIPGICALYAVVVMRSPWSGVLLVAVFLIAFVLMIMGFKSPRVK